MKRITSKLSLLLATAITLATISITSCSKSDSGSPGGPSAPTNPGGYDSSAQIQPGALVAFWPFNGSLTDSKGGLSGTNAGVTFNTGLNGKMAYKGGPDQTYASYTSSNAIKSMTSFTIAFWMNSAQVTSGAQAILQLSNPTQYWPELDIDLEGYNPAWGPGDSLHLKMYMENAANNVWTVAPQAVLDSAAGKWTHVVITYSAASGSVSIYQNGLGIYLTYPYSQNTTIPNGSVGPVPFYTSDPGSLTNSNHAPSWGNADFSVSNNFVIGAWQGQVTPAFNPGQGSDTWNNSYQGLLQNFRIYNTALSASDVASLFILERGGF